MQLLSIVRARAVWLVDFQDLNPSGKDLQEELVKWVRDSYSFRISPAPEDAGKPAPNGLVFTGGRFQKPGGAVGVDLTVFSDGLVADTRSSTRDADEFLGALLESARSEFDLTYYRNLVTRKDYWSEVHVRSDAKLGMINVRLQEFARQVAASVPDKSLEFDLSAIGLWTNPGRGGKALAFRFERQESRDFADSRYYSSAPVHTDDHLRLLNELESILVAVPSSI